MNILNNKYDTMPGDIIAVIILSNHLAYFNIVCAI